MKILLNTAKISSFAPTPTEESTLISEVKNQVISLLPPIDAKGVLLTVGFFMAATSLRWILKSWTKNEFDDVKTPQEMAPICKFCQILNAVSGGN